MPAGRSRRHGAHTTDRESSIHRIPAGVVHSLPPRGIDALDRLGRDQNRQSKQHAYLLRRLLDQRAVQRLLDGRNCRRHSQLDERGLEKRRPSQVGLDAIENRCRRIVPQRFDHAPGAPLEKVVSGDERLLEVLLRWRGLMRRFDQADRIELHRHGA